MLGLKLIDVNKGTGFPAVMDFKRQQMVKSHRMTSRLTTHLLSIGRADWSK